MSQLRESRAGITAGWNLAVSRVIAALAVLLMSALQSLQAADVGKGGFQNGADARVSYEEASKALNRRDLDALGRFLRVNPGALNHQYSSGSTLLGMAAYRGDIQAVRMLLSMGGIPDSGRAARDRPLAKTISGLGFLWIDREWPVGKSASDYLEIVVELIEAGADYQFNLLYEKPSQVRTFIEELMITVCDKSVFDSDLHRVMKDKRNSPNLREGKITQDGELVINTLLLAGVVNSTCIEHFRSLL